MNKPLSTNTLLSFPKHYISEKTLKRVNISAFKLFFLKTIFKDIKDKNAIKKFIFFDKSTVMIIFVLDNYYY